MSPALVSDNVQLIMFSEVMKIGKGSQAIKFSKIKFVTISVHHNYFYFSIFTYCVCNFSPTDTSQWIFLQFCLPVAAQETLKGAYSLEDHGIQRFLK